jgi:hypothetical protein
LPWEFAGQTPTVVAGVLWGVYRWAYRKFQACRVVVILRKMTLFGASIK